MKKAQFLLFILILGILLNFSCSDNTKSSEPEDNTESNNNSSANSENNEDTTYSVSVDTSMIYIPSDLQGMDLFSSSSTWYYGRSKQSDHFIVFWGKEYGDMDPDSSAIDDTYRVDIDDLLEKAESFYDVNINTLKFAVVGSGESNLDKYKMMIFLYYQDEWLATGSGYDNVIGALWVSPSTCQPVGSTIAHEIGHSFQYQVYCDLGGTTGYRYGFGSTGGNTFWEQCAQWQAWQCYPDEVFDNYYYTEYCSNYNKHICHEDYRYASYFIQYYWAEQHGIDIVGKLWRNSEEPEDAIETYMRLTGLSVSDFNDEIYDAATKFVTWDLDLLRDYGADYIGDQEYSCTTLDDGSYQVSYDYCPGTTGYNVIPLNVPDAGTIVSTEFTGQVNADGFNTVDDETRAGWRYGYVALLEDGTRDYGVMNQGTTNTVEYTVPSGCSKLWFVVTGAPNTYEVHGWDDDNSNDDQWPYQLSFTNTDIYGNYSFDGTETPESTELTYDINFDYSDSAYDGTTVEVEGADIATAFVIQPSELAGLMDADITFYGVEPDGTLNSTSTANGYGHWFDADGNVCSWGDEAMVYSEFSESDLTFTIGQYPGHCISGTTYTIKQALVYEYEEGSSVQLTFVFNITIN